jgi:hypothetical protein
MRYHTRLLVLPMAIAVAMPATFQAQTNDFTMSNRWNRLVAQFYADASASRRAARATAAAAHDSVALRRIAMTQPPLTFLVYTPLRSTVRCGEFCEREQERFGGRRGRERVGRRAYRDVR